MLRMLADDLVCGGEEVQKMRNKVFSLNAPEEDSPTSPLNITTRVMKHCLNVTARGREWMEQNPKEKLPRYVLKGIQSSNNSAATTQLIQERWITQRV